MKVQARRVDPRGRELGRSWNASVTLQRSRHLFEKLVLFALPHLPVAWPRASHGVGAACKRASIPHLSPKDLRRTAASWLLAAGAAQPIVSRLLRHRNDAMVRMVYGRVSPTELGALLKRASKTLQSAKNHSRPLGGMADAGDLKSLASNGVPVRVREGPPVRAMRVARLWRSWW